MSENIYMYENITESLSELTTSLELTTTNPSPTSAATIAALQLYADKSNTHFFPLLLTDRAASSPAEEEREGGYTEERGGGYTRTRAGDNTATRRDEVSAALDDNNILPEGSKRTRKPRRDAYSTALQRAGGGELYGFHTAFGHGYTTPEPKQAPQEELHRNKMPPPPRYYKEVLEHPHALGFLQAITTEIEALQSKNTWKEFDAEGYLAKYKARLCALGDLQHTEQDTYAATLAARTFRTLMALVAAFNLETRQYDAVNVFANSKINETIYCKLPEGYPGFKDKSKHTLLLLQQALCGLKQSPLLWHRDLSAKLMKLNLNKIPGVNYLYTNRHIIVFFFVDDIVVMFKSADSRYNGRRPRRSSLMD
jgi:hypothetical protein